MSQGRATVYNKAESDFIEAHKHLPRRELHALFVQRFNRADVTYFNIKDVCKRNGWRKRDPTQYSSAELAFLMRRQHMARNDLHLAFVKKFSRTDITIWMMAGLFKRQGWEWKGNRVSYSPKELMFIEKNKHLARGVLHHEFVARFGRTDVSVSTLSHMCVRRGWHTGRPKLAVALGHERIGKRGEMLVRVETHCREQRFRNFRPKQHVLWEKLHGPLPKGHILKCISGDKTDCDPLNWVCVTVGIGNRLRKRGWQGAPSELRPTILAASKLEHKLWQAKEPAE